MLQRFQILGTLIILVILWTVISTLFQIALVPDPCATKKKPFTFRANYTGSVVFILWKRRDLNGEITLSISNQTNCVILPSKVYNLTRYTFQCNYTLHEYTMTIKQVEEDELGSNWTVTIQTFSGLVTSNYSQITSCETDEQQDAFQKDHNELSNRVIGGVVVGICVVALILAPVLLNIYRKRNGSIPSDESRDCHYTVKITTGVEDCVKIHSTAWIDIIGAEGEKTGKIKLDDVDGNGFNPGTTKTFGINAAAVGNIKSIVLGCDSDSSIASKWFVKQVVVEVPGKHYVFIFDCYIPYNENGEKREIDTHADATSVPKETSKRPNNHLEPIVHPGPAGAFNMRNISKEQNESGQICDKTSYFGENDETIEDPSMRLVDLY